ncbi:MAG: PepSY domain-containing protein [Gammaproteobacteria bacterium]|nr:PepSY domain-containing protein [Gammaproteobacteria bacterium]
MGATDEDRAPRHGRTRPARIRECRRRVSPWRERLLVAFVLAALSAPLASRGDDDRAVRGAPVASVMQLLERVRRDYRGDVLELELEDEDGRPEYEVKLLTPQGNVLKLYYDARTLEVLEVEGRHEDRDDGGRRRKGGGS